MPRPSAVCALLYVACVLSVLPSALSIPLRPASSEHPAVGTLAGLSLQKKDFGGLFGDGGPIYPPPAEPEPIVKDPFTTLRTTPTVTALGKDIFETGSSSSSMKISTKTKDAMHTSTTSAEISSPTSYLITGTTTNGPTTAPATDIFARPLATSTAAAPIPSTSSSLPGLSGVSTEWKVLGIAVIAISGLAVMVITVVFYDAWSGFLLDILCCGQRKKGADGAEEFVPDWEKRSWEVQLKAQGEDRYPSVEDLAQPRAVVRRPGIVPLDPRPASDVLRCANPFESHLDYQQAPYEHDTGDIIPDPYPQAHVAPSDGRHERTYTVTPNPYDGIA